MSVSLNNVATADAYGSASITQVGTARFTVIAANAAVFMRETYRNVDGSITVGAEVFLPPGFYALTRPVNTVEFRSAVAGVPARVTTQLLTGAEAGA